VVFVANHRAELVDHKSLLKRIAGLPAKRRAMVRDLSCLIAMSDAIEEELLEYGVEPGRIARIPMGVNVERFRPAADDDERAAARAQMGWPERLTVVFSGAMVRRKQPHLLIEAIARSAAEGVDAQVALVGPPQDEDYVAEMRQRAQELGAADRVIWAGFTETPEIANRAADVFSLPSLKEGMSAALVEAMACGLPCVVTPVSGSGDLIDDGVNGRIVPAEVEPVVEALLGYLQDASVRRTHGQRARQVVEQRYSHVAVLNAYEQLFRRLLRGQPAAAEADSR
jgi:glycosyltransferase involved in cell wall biosynthesis